MSALNTFSKLLLATAFPFPILKMTLQRCGDEALAPPSLDTGPNRMSASVREDSAQLIATTSLGDIHSPDRYARESAPAKAR